MAYNIGDTYVGRSLDLYGEYVEAETAILDQLLKPGMVALDIGANMGAHTVYMAKKVGLEGAVAAFEPQRHIFQLLCANVALNGLMNVHTYHAAVGAENGNIHVPVVNYEKGGNFGGLSLIDVERGEPVLCHTLDGLNFNRCDVMKVDVEGMEHEVLVGGAKTIKKFRPVLYMENDRRERAELLLAHLFELEYRVYWHLPSLFNPDNFFQNRDNVFGNLISRNILCLPREREINVEKMQEITDPAVKF
ncbi:MAG: FkbM family methyltransferase [Rhodospirillaceae bacterium]|nr:FkbM family methyltransferase [Rhodospirillaceae bacterium]